MFGRFLGYTFSAAAIPAYLMFALVEDFGLGLIVGDENSGKLSAEFEANLNETARGIAGQGQGEN